MLSHRKFPLDEDELENIQILMEHWADDAPAQIQAISGELQRASQAVHDATHDAGRVSRFAFVNALISRFMDAA